MRILLLLALLFPIIGNAQSISVAPHSIQAWGSTPSMASMSVDYKDIGFMGVVPVEHKVDKHNNPTISNIGVYWKPIQIDNVVKVGTIIFYRGFPTDTGQRFHFIIDLGYTFNWFRVSYIHISNAHINDFNPGIDFIQISIVINQ